MFQIGEYLPTTNCLFFTLPTLLIVFGVTLRAN
jgi:hypothetical protein